MARIFLMSWVPKTSTWMKEYKKKKYAVSCRQLNAPPTKEGSYQQANAWWEAKKAQLDGCAVKPVHPHADLLEELERKHAFASRHGLTEEAEELAGRIEGVKSSPAGTYVGVDPETDRRKGALRLLQILGIGVDELEPDQLAALVGTKQLWEDRLGRQPVAPPDRTIATHADAWLQHQQAVVAAGQMSPDRAGNNRTCLEHFKSFIGHSADVGSIDGPCLRRFYLKCVGQFAARLNNRETGWSVAYARDVFSVTKGFIRWMWEEGTIDLPKNIGSKSFKFGSSAQTISTWTPEEFRLVVSEARGTLRLGLLLMANCGMTQIDASDLLDTEVDWEEGRIIRKRSKERHAENVPTVNYKLWPLTFKLLQKYRSGTERVLLTESGKPYVRKELIEGKTSKADGFASNFVHLKKRLKLRLPLKELRKLSATLLEEHKEYGRFGSYFLGHSPRTVKDKHYAAPPQALFDEVVSWLGQQLGVPVR